MHAMHACTPPPRLRPPCALSTLHFCRSGRSLCFISCHLAAHQDASKKLRRNSDVAEIFQNARVGARDLDLDVQFDHVFVRDAQLSFRGCRLLLSDFVGF